MMRRLPLILFIVFYCTGTLLSPFGDLFATKNISDIYTQCKEEDPDINPLDFVFEHLLNLESVFEQFENKGDEDSNEKPHQPFQQLQSSSPVLVITARRLQIETEPFTYYISCERTYPICRDNLMPSAFLTEVFHPPSALAV